jgi:predicted unusual protein kinase regulating ubiquinone biosynthesis (AarF/ABC1/UbiB family)
VKSLLTELKERIAEELDYAAEAKNQHTYAEGYADDPGIVVPDVVAQQGTVLVTEWIDGIPLSKIISAGTPEQRNEAGRLLLGFLFSGPGRVGLLHADPHPGNFRLMPVEGAGEEGPWQLGVLDFGAVNRLPGGMPEAIGTAIRYALQDDADEVVRILSGEGFVRPGITMDPQEALDYLAPLLDPLRAEIFTYSRAWLRDQGSHLSGRGNPAASVGRRFNLPPNYMLIHRVSMGTLGILCQLGSTIAVREVLEPCLPGLSPEA